MKRRVMPSCLVLMMVHPLIAQMTPARVRDAVEHLPIGGKMTVRTMDGRELHGNLWAVDAETFVLRDVDLNMEKVYGRKGFAVRRISPRRSRIAAIFVLGGFGVLIAVVALTKD